MDLALSYSNQMRIVEAPASGGGLRSLTSLFDWNYLYIYIIDLLHSKFRA